MDTYVDERDYKLLENEKYTFFVLKRIIGGECKLLLTDHDFVASCARSGKASCGECYFNSLL